MLNSREILRWLVIGFVFGTGWALAKFVWGALAGLLMVLLPAVALAALAWIVFSRLRPAEARRLWRQGIARLVSAAWSGRGSAGGAGRTQVFRGR